MNRVQIEELLRQLQERKLSRRSVARSAVMLGLSLGAAEALAACPWSQQSRPWL